MHSQGTLCVPKEALNSPLKKDHSAFALQHFTCTLSGFALKRRIAETIDRYGRLAGYRKEERSETSIRSTEGRKRERPEPNEAREWDDEHRERREEKSRTPINFLSVQVVGLGLLESSVSSSSAGSVIRGSTTLDTTLGELEGRAERTRLLESLGEHLVTSDVGVGDWNVKRRSNGQHEGRNRPWSVRMKAHLIVERTSWPPRSERW